jgi:hypothetical protein
LLLLLPPPPPPLLLIPGMVFQLVKALCRTACLGASAEERGGWTAASW